MMSTANPLRILAIGAHPDDIEFACAGTLARCIGRGDQVTIAIVCRGESASCGMTAEELVAVRSKEAADAARVLGADLIQMGCPDYGVWYNREMLTALTDVIRRAQPDVIITHYSADYGGDHNNTLKLAVDASLAATVSNFQTPTPALGKMPILYMMEPVGGYGFQPQTYVDVTDTLAIRLKMMDCHKSQIAWMSRYGGFDSKLYIETVARFRGYQCGAKYAEGFIAHASFGHTPVGTVLP
jgi:LmbE family N-acetylglucosaminyl deacetylase